MVRFKRLRTFFAPKAPCGPLCQDIERELESMRRAQSLDTLFKRKGSGG